MYKDEVVRAMNYLASKDKTIFIGQGVTNWGCVYNTLEQVPNSKKIELPVFEDTQMGLSIGLSLVGYVPITIYARMDFIILAINQLVNHLDKLEEISDGEFKPKVIIRTIIGSKTPLYPGAQHCQDHTEMLRCGLTTIDVVKLTDEKTIFNAYINAFNSDKSTLIVEDRSLYDRSTG